MLLAAAAAVSSSAAAVAVGGMLSASLMAAGNLAISLVSHEDIMGCQPTISAGM
jgi:hypothetical protein